MAKRRKSTDIQADLDARRSIVLEVEGMDEPSEDDISRSDTALDETEALQDELAEALAHEDRVEALRNADYSGATEGGDNSARGEREVQRNRGPEVMTGVEPFEILRGSTAHMDPNEYAQVLRSSNLKAMEEFDMPKGYEGSFEGYIKRHLNARGRNGHEKIAWGRNLLERMTPDYIGAFEKVMVGDTISLTDVERAAIAVGTNTAGGYLVPTHLDPTLIMTNAGAKDVVRTLSRVVTLVGGANKWNGVTTAGATASWDAELTEVSDDTPPVGPVSIPVFSAKSLIQASIESFEDITGLAADVQMLLADARIRLEAAAHMTGTGSGQPTGIFPALTSNTNVTLSLTTGRTFTVPDLDRVSNALGDRWTDGAKWLMHPSVLGEIVALGTALGNSYTVDLTQPYPDQLRGFPVAKSFTAPNTNQTTTVDNLLVFGLFDNYVIVDKPGSTAIEFIPHLFNTSNNLPDGRRAWYMHFRNGADSVNDLAFRVLQDKTTA